MAINVSVKYNGGCLLDIILLTLCYWGTQFNAMKRFLSWQPMFPPKRFETFCSPCLGDPQKVRMRSDFSLNGRL